MDILKKQAFIKPLGATSRMEIVEISVEASDFDLAEQEGFLYQEGEYLAGKDSLEGEYAFFGTTDELSDYVCVYANAKKASIVEKNFDTNCYMTVKNEQLFAVSRGGVCSA